MEDEKTNYKIVKMRLTITITYLRIPTTPWYVLQCVKIPYCTYTCVTHFGNTADLSVPMQFPRHGVGIDWEVPRYCNEKLDIG